MLNESVVIDNENYKKGLWELGILTEELWLDYTLSSDDGERYELIRGNAVFAENKHLVVIDSDGNTTIPKNKINLIIRKSDSDIKKSAELNFKDYFGDVTKSELLEFYGFGKACNTGFTHITYFDNMYSVKKVECIVVLTDEVYDELAKFLQSNSLSKITLGVNCFNLFEKERTQDNKDEFVSGYEGDNFYLMAEKKDVELFATTFGFIDLLKVQTNKSTFKVADNKEIEENKTLPLSDFEKSLLISLKDIGKLLLFVIILLLSIILFK